MDQQLAEASRLPGVFNAHAGATVRLLAIVSPT